MKIIEAMKKLKYYETKIVELKEKISKNLYHYEHEDTEYENPKARVSEWKQSIKDTLKEMVNLKIRIQKTNLITNVSIEIDEKNVTKSIAEWILRRREFNQKELSFIKIFNVGTIPKLVKYDKEDGEPAAAKLIQHFSSEERDKELKYLGEEKFAIDSALEITNAVTDLVD